MIKNYIFDFGNVLVRFDPVLLTEACTPDPEERDAIWPVVFDRLYWDPLDWGGISDEEIKAQCRRRLPENLWQKAELVYDKWMENLTFLPGMEALVRDVKAKGGRLYLLSNISVGFAESWQSVPQLAAFFSQFDGLVFSGPLGIVKPSPEIFRHLLDTYGLKAEESIFIDDSEKNTRGAEAIGLPAYRFDGDAEALRAFLDL